MARIMTCFLVIFVWILLSMPLLTKSWHTNFAHDLMGRSHKQQLMNMSEELLKDMKVKQRQIHMIRNEHNHLLAYDVGLVIGKIRELYKRMMTIYRMADDRLTKKYMINPPGIYRYRPFNYIVEMEMMHALQVDIDKHIHVLESVPPETLLDKSASEFVGPGPNHMGNPSMSSEEKKPRPSLRTSNNTDNREFAPKPSLQNEDDIKQRYRDQYKERSGHSGNWTLDEYYGIV